MIKIINEVNFDKWEEENNFGEEWVVDIPRECIKGATLLSKEEYEKYKKNIPLIDNWWWLRSAGIDCYSACSVDSDGSVFYLGYRVYCGVGCVRPALILNLQSSNLNFDIGDKFEFGERIFTIISNDLAICDDIIGKGCFREDWKSEDANVYEKSDAKKVVDDWFNKSYREYGE